MDDFKADAPVPDAKKAKKHFHDHVAAVATSTAKINHHVAELRKTGLNDKQTEIVHNLTAETAQLHLAVNNAVAVPDEDEDAENTAGAATTEVVDPNAHQD